MAPLYAQADMRHGLVLTRPVVHLETVNEPKFPDRLPGPFGPARYVQSLPTMALRSAYYVRFGLDLKPWLGDLEELTLWECEQTGYRFWRPGQVVGDEAFYRAISSAEADHNQETRWEHPIARSFIPPQSRVLEVGCGGGHFLHSLEGLAERAIGLNFNEQAIAQKHTKSPILAQPLSEYADARAGALDVVCAFQVLEHVPDPHVFLRDALRCLRDGGLLILSTPNADAAVFQRREDALDLPPHHIGHFSAHTFERIARQLELEIVDIRAELKTSSFQETVTERTRNHMAYKLALNLARRGLDKLYAQLGEPGRTLVAVLRKPHRT